MNKDALLPCPFPDCCAGLITGFHGDEDGGYGFVECKSAEHFCGIHADTESDAITAWNRRITAALAEKDGDSSVSGGWISVAERLPEDNRRLLVTNNIDARDAHGEMSHLWLVRMIHQPGEHPYFTAYTENMVLIHNITHYRYPLPKEPK